MKKGLFILSVFTVLTFTNNINAYSEEWNYIGFSKINDETVFYVFTMKKNEGNSENIKLVQKHIFGEPQKLSDGREFDSVLIDRTLNCKNKSISIDKIIISNGIGNKLDTYINKSGSGNSSITSENKIDLNLFEHYCI